RPGGPLRPGPFRPDQRAVLADRLAERTRHDLAGSRGKEIDQLIAFAAPRREAGPDGDAVRHQGAGDVHALASRVHLGGRGPNDLTPVQRRDLEGAVDGGVGGEGDDHASTTSTPASSRACTWAGARPLSDTRASSWSIEAKRTVSSSPTFVWSASTTTCCAARLMAPFTAASAGSGVDRPRSTVRPLVPTKATSTLRSASWRSAQSPTWAS